MNIEYMGIDIPCKNISGLSFSEKIDNDNCGIIDVSLANTESNKIITGNLLGEIKIKFKDYTFNNFVLVRDSVSYTNTEIHLQLRHRISDMLSQPMNVNYVNNDGDGSTTDDDNPARCIREILELAGVTSYSQSDIQCLYQWCANIGEKMDVCYYHLVDVSFREVLNEICGKLGVIVYVDYADNILRFFNYCNLPVGFEYNEVFRPYVKKKNESVGDEYYNSFKIGIYPDSYVMQQIRYKYKCSNATYSNVWFDEDDINLEQQSGDTYSVTLKYNKYDVTNSIVYEANSLWTTDITERVAITTNVSADVMRLAEYSATTLYGTPENPAWSIWEDENVYNDTACCRHTNPDGAAAIGNSIVTRFYRKQKKLSLEMAKFMPFSNGEILTFEGKNWILIEQKINDDMSATMELEELIND